MQLLRMFSTESYKGTQNYLRTQKKYEIGRTVLYFGISLCLFIAGYIATKTRINLLTIVAILGCLPASKSAVEMIMYLRFKSCSHEYCDKINAHMDESMTGLYDMVFTTYDKNYQVDHLTVKGNTICGFSQDKNFREQNFSKHITDTLKTDHFTDVSVKIFTDIDKYVNRLEQLKQLDNDTTNTAGIVNTLKSVSL